MKIKNIFLSILAITALVGGVFAYSESTFAAGTYFQGFETDTSDWSDSDNGWYGTITRVASGALGVTSYEGDWHAVAEGDGTSAPFSGFDMYRDTWDGQWTAELAVYLDTDWPVGTGYDYSVAATGSDGNHQRDFIFHITKDTSSGDLLVGGSNNSNFAPREDLENINHYVVPENGWYVMQHVFRNDGGVLAVDLNLLDSEGNVVFTETRTDVADTIPGEVGGNRYAWFTFINVPDGVAVDSHNLTMYPYGEIISPAENENVTGTLNLIAAYFDGDDINDDPVQWAVRMGTCAAGTNTVAGNVDGFTDVYNWDGSDFSSTLDVSTYESGDYCFIFNPTDDPGQNNVRETVEFKIIKATPTDKEECKNGGWEMFTNPEFRNQGDCVSWLQADENAVGNRKDNGGPQPGPQEDPEPEVLGVQAQNGNGKPEAPGKSEKATGGIVIEENNGSHASVEFNAHETDPAKGEFIWRLMDNEGNVTREIRVEVEEVDVDGNMAQFSGHATYDSLGGAKEGDAFGVKVVDNGEPGTSDEIRWGWDGDFYNNVKPILEGNIQVHTR